MVTISPLLGIHRSWKKKIGNDNDSRSDDEATSYTTASGNKVYLEASATSTGFVFQYSLDRVFWKAISYSENSKEWICRPYHKHDEMTIPNHMIVSMHKAMHMHDGTDEGRRAHLNRLFPDTDFTALAELDNETDHRFKRQDLLAEALTHCSAQTRAVHANDHLAYIGEVVMRAYATDMAIREASFFNSRLHISIKESDVLGDSFCMPAGAMESSPLSEEKGSENTFFKNALVTSLERRVKVCCNHVSYAASCIKSNIHVNMTCGSPVCPSVKELKENIRQFEKKMPREKNETTDWKRLFQAGAPKALGDLFLAVIGAITMDADTSEAHDMMEKHYKYSQEIFDIMETGIADHSILCIHDPKFERELSNESLQQLLRDAPKLAISCQLSPAGEWVDTDMLKRCNDISVLQVKHTKKKSGSARLLAHSWCT